MGERDLHSLLEKMNGQGSLESGGRFVSRSPPPTNPRYVENCEKGAWALRFTKRAGYGSPFLYLEFWALRQEALWFDVSLEDREFQMSLDYTVKSAKDKHLSSSPPFQTPNNNNKQKTKSGDKGCFPNRPEGAWWREDTGHRAHSWLLVTVEVL